MKYTFCARTDRGRLRALNEDSVSIHARAQVAVLADGMGGYNAGEVASAMATDLVCGKMASWRSRMNDSIPTGALARALQVSVQSANTAIFRAARDNPAYSGMGTTIVALGFEGDRMAVAHVGDSRCYRWRNGTLEQITRDHSWLQEQVDAGWLTPAQAAQSGARNLVTRALGVEPMVMVDVAEHEVQQGDHFLLCSDGLSEMLSHEAIESLLQGTRDFLQEPLEPAAIRLIQAANENGGRDNISVVLVRAALGESGRRRGLWSRLLRTA